MHFEFLLCARDFPRPRQFSIEASAVLDGAALHRVLAMHFPTRRWFCAGLPLEQHPAFDSLGGYLVSDLPTGITGSRQRGAGALALYVLNGPDAGAQIALVPGSHPVGRCAPLWLADPAIGRVHAMVQVDHRSITLTAGPGHSLEALDVPGQGPGLSQLQLVRGSRFRLGETVFAVDDPGAALHFDTAQWPATPPQVPPKPEIQRLLTLLLAAIIPLAIGVLLAVTTGSRIFLMIAGLSALFGLLPAGQLLAARRSWTRRVRQRVSELVQLRQQLAPQLGTVIAAGAAGGLAHAPVGWLPTVVFGQGTWDLAAQDHPPQAREAAARAQGTSADSAVFALTATGHWQLITEDYRRGLETLAAILARLLPVVVAGKVQLVIDPGLVGLPSSLLLLSNVRLGVAPAPARPGLLGPVPGAGQLRTIYLLREPRPGLSDSLVLCLSRVQSAAVGYWINLDTLQAQLDDPQATLRQLEHLHLERFCRIIDQHLQAQLSTGAKVPAVAAASAPGSLSCHIGQGADGAAVCVDLEADGPHMLLAGTTGSGKSEALRRIVIDLAHRYPPTELAFALVDFKGGASLSVFASLPHVQLFASDLDAAGALRMIEQLEREILRRERLLARHGCSDVNEYRLQAPPAPALPRLLVVIDEFRVFIDGLAAAGARIDRIATVGRALGIHLLLSTQKPSGTLSGQTRANINAVIALRVREASESIDLVGTAQAAALTRPGSAVIRSTTFSGAQFQFHLAAAGQPWGVLAERARFDFGSGPALHFGAQPTGAQGMQVLQERTGQVAERWQGGPEVSNPFAPPLPGLITALPPQLPPPPTAAITCGLVDDLDQGASTALRLAVPGARTVLACGLPEAGTAQLSTQLLKASKRILYFDPSPVPSNAERSHIVQVTGRDPYQLCDALDYLAGEADLADVLVLVRNLAGLSAALHPSDFSRLDDVVGTLIRRSQVSQVTVVLVADRDAGVLKAASLCTSRWYFPLDAPDSLTMTWPKLPPVSPIPGRGISFAPDGTALAIQLTTLPDCAPVRPWRCSARCSPAPADGLRVGATGLLDTPAFLADGPLRFMLVADAQLRGELARVLCARWGTQLLGYQQLEADVLPAGVVAVLLEAPADAVVQAWLSRARTAGVCPVVFCAPSARLAYDYALPGMQLDDRHVVAVEATHPFDLQPMSWRPLGVQEADRVCSHWRAIMLVNGQPREVRIPWPTD